MGKKKPSSAIVSQQQISYFGASLKDNVNAEFMLNFNRTRSADILS